MRILQLCKKFPYPLKDGESIAVTYLSKALHELGCEMTLLAMNTSKHHSDLKRLPNTFDHYTKIETVEITNEVTVFGAIANLFSNQSYHVSRFVSAEFERKLIELLVDKDFDIIQLETLYVTPYIPIIRKYSTAKIVLRSHNIEHEIWQRITENISFLPKKWYLSYLTIKLRRFEIAQMYRYDALVAISERDLEFHRNLGYEREAISIPIGLDERDYTANDKSFHQPLSLCFIGSLDWAPNIEGLVWFLKNIWVSLERRYPKLKLHIAGRNAPEWLYKWQSEKVLIYGEVPSAVEFINKHSVMVVPLLSGSGMRAKILEGMALGKVVLTTSLGLEGIEARHKQEVLVADTLEEFITCIGFCYQQKERLVNIGQRAQVFISAEYSNFTVAKRLKIFYKELLKQKAKKGEYLRIINFL